jgi:hypothetical protein
VSKASIEPHRFRTKSGKFATSNLDPAASQHRQPGIRLEQATTFTNHDSTIRILQEFWGFPYLRASVRVIFWDYDFLMTFLILHLMMTYGSDWFFFDDSYHR